MRLAGWPLHVVSSLTSTSLDLKLTWQELHDAYPIYRWFPDKLINATRSAENLAYELRHKIAAHPNWTPDALATYICSQLIELGLGVYDATDEELDRLVDNAHDPWPASYVFADIISRRAQVGWSTHGHSAVDVNIYASKPEHARALIGNHENTEIGDFIRDYLDVDLDAVTEELRKAGAMLHMGLQLPENRTQADLDHYQGDFKRSLDCGCSTHDTRLLVDFSSI